jgi:serine/threonine-protein kinase
MVLPAPASGTPVGHRDRLPNRSRYELLLKIASGGMATVYLGRLSAAHGFWRLVAIKRAHAHLVEDAQFRQMLVAEARLASRIHHPNVVSVHDIEELDGELLLVMDYVEGAALSRLAVAASGPLPPGLVVRIALDACAGLDAAHELRDENGNPLGLVHRDVSPQNILVGVDGVSRITDFGIAKSTISTFATTTHALKGKPGYMAPEYVARGEVGRRGDVFAMGVVVWEALAGRRLFHGANEIQTMNLVTTTDAPPASTVAAGLSPLNAPLRRALARQSEERYPTVGEFAADLEAAGRAAGLLASHAEVASYVRSVVSDALEQRKTLVRARLDPAAPGHPITAEIAVSPAAPPDSTLSGGSSRPTLSEARARVSDRMTRTWIGAAAGTLVIMGVGLGLGFRRSPRSEEGTSPGATAKAGSPSPSPSWMPNVIEGSPAAPAERTTRAVEPDGAMGSGSVPRVDGRGAAPVGRSRRPHPANAAPAPAHSIEPDRAPPNPYASAAR